MYRFYHPGVNDSLDETSLEDSEAHHAIRVLRVGIGDDITLLNGRGAEYFCKCAAVFKDKLTLKIVGKKQHPPPEHNIILIQAIPKKRLIEDIIEKSIELGANRIIPLLTKRVIPDLETKTKRVERWRQISISAIKQCGQTYLPQIDDPIDISRLLNKNEKCELNLICAIETGAKHPRKYFDTFRQTYKRNPMSVAIWVGPEGDFTPEELEAVKSAGVKPINLGKLILRVETAAIYALSIVNYELNWRAKS